MHSALPPTIQQLPEIAQLPVVMGLTVSSVAAKQKKLISSFATQIQN